MDDKSSEWRSGVRLAALLLSAYATSFLVLIVLGILPDHAPVAISYLFWPLTKLWELFV